MLAVLAASGSGLAAVAAAAAAAAARVSRAAGTFGDREPRNRWLMVTVNRPPGQFPAASELPEPVTRLHDRAEVMIRPAPAGRGTELGLRLREAPPASSVSLGARLSGTDPRRELRAALRDAKSLIETGEVIVPDEPPTTHPGPLGKPLDLLIRRSGQEGRL